MKKKYLLLSVIILIIIVSLGYSAQPIQAEASSVLAKNGVYTIYHFNHDQQLPLIGEWEFYFNNLYTPEDFANQKIKKKPDYVMVPKDWNHYDDQTITRKGYATYRLQVNIPKSEVGTIKALYIPSIASSYILWVNGERKASGGVVGTSKATTTPETTSKIIQFQPQSQTIELVIQAANYNQRKSGISSSLLFGDPEIIHTHQEQTNIFRGIVVTSLFIIGLYHFALFALRKNEFSFLYFGGFCVAISIRATLIEEGLASFLLSFLNWEIASKFEYLGASLGVLCFTLYSYTQFHLDMNLKILKLIIGSMVLFTIYIIATPAIIYTVTMVPFQIMIMSILVYNMYIYILAVIRKRSGSLLNLFAMGALFMAALNDTLFFNELVDTTEMTSIGLIFFLLTQSFHLSKKYSKSYHEIEKLSEDLKVFNQSLEKEVVERTAELKRSNEKLHEANEARRQLLSNISHELGTPLTSIQGYTKAMADGVVPIDKKYLQLVYGKVVYLSKILNDLHALTEIETRQLNFEMRKVNIQEYCLQLYEKLQLDIDNSAIIFNFRDILPIGKKYFVCIDPIRIEQVIINFMTNASKFITKNAKITLQLSLTVEEHIMVQCIDNGIGIEEEAIQLVFERFYKSYTNENPNKGAGLGLAISKEIIEAHKGKIGVESKANEGSCFYFTLPIYKIKLKE